MAATRCRCGRWMSPALRYGLTPEPEAVELCLGCGAETNPPPCCVRRRRTPAQRVLVTEKLCRLGGHVAPIEAFPPRSGVPTATRGSCRACLNARARAQYQPAVTMLSRLLALLADGAPRTMADLAEHLYGAAERAEREAVGTLVFRARRRTGHLVFHARRAGQRIEWSPATRTYRLVTESERRAS